MGNRLLKVMMNNKKKKGVIYFNFIGFVLHFAALVLYAFPQNSLPEWVAKPLNFYINPQFHFNFRVFAPEPPTESELFVFRYHLTNGEKTSWKEEGRELLEEAYSNRFSSAYNRWKIQSFVGFRLFELYERLMLTSGNVGLPETEQQMTVMRQLTVYPAYKNAVKFVTQKAENYVAYNKVKALEFAYLKIPVDNRQKPVIQKFPIFYLNND